MLGLCPNCEKDCELTFHSHVEESTIRGEKIPVTVEYYTCNECGEEFTNPGQLEKSLQEGYNKYRKIADILFPSDIVAIRKKYGASQKAFAKILDLGELTINSFEQGSLPSKSVSNLIRLMDEPANFSRLFQKNKNRLSPHQIRKIESHLTKQTTSLYEGKDLDEMIEVCEPFKGYTRPDWEKYISLLQIILSYAGCSLYKMALLKIAFYSDFTAYKRMHCSLTGWPYAAITHGPVPDEWKTLIRYAEEGGYLSYEPDDREVGELFFLPESVHIEEVEKRFTESELKIIKEITLTLKDKSATELRNLSHKEDAWKKTDNAKKIPYSCAETLKLF